MNLLLAVLAVFGVVTVITQSDGPGGLFYRLRRKSNLFTCIPCLSVLVGFLVALVTVDGLKNIIIYTLAYAGGAILLSQLGE